MISCFLILDMVCGEILCSEVVGEHPTVASKLKCGLLADETATT
jgi:hypothetical protein